MFEDGMLDHGSAASIRTSFECGRCRFSRAQRPKLRPGRRQLCFFRLAKFEAGGDRDACQGRDKSDDTQVDD
jgi:hypothetical protein